MPPPHDSASSDPQTPDLGRRLRRLLPWLGRTPGGADGTAAARSGGARDFVLRHPVLVTVASTVGLIVAATAAVPLTGHSEEAIAWMGEQVFRVAPLPDDVDRPPERSRVYDRDGNLIAHLTGPQNRVLVTLDDVAEVMQQAVVATEDSRFWEHDGVDARGIFRAAFRNLREGSVAEGASTITQQYIKSALLTPEQSLERKITEATWAVQLERRLSKEEILERYLNVVYFGHGAYGIGAAAEYYFGHPAAELDLTEAALLASVLTAPGRVDLEGSPESARPGRDAVIDEMTAQGFVDPGEAERAKAATVASTLDVTPLPSPEEPLFVRHIVDLLLESPALGETRTQRANQLFSGGLDIVTTVDPRLQQEADATIEEFLTDPLEHPMAGIVSVEPGDGAIRAMALGPKSWGPCGDVPPAQCETTTVNPLVPGAGSPGRQVGSAFKPIVLAAALEQGLGPDWHTDTEGGEPIEGCPADWEPDNYSERSAGVIDTPEALRVSNNVFFVKLGVATGLENVADTADRLGLHDVPPFCSIALGSVEAHPLTMASAYATFAARGTYCQPYAVAEIRDTAGEFVYSHRTQCREVLDPEIADAVTTMLTEVVDRGTAGRAAIGRPAAAKTGTTDDFRDAWLVGYTPQLATAVWVGYEVPREMTGVLGYRRISGGTLPAQIWGTYMAAAMEPLDPAAFELVGLDRYDGSCQDRDSFEDGRQGCRSPEVSDPPSPSETPTEEASPAATPTDVDGTEQPSQEPTSEEPTEQPSEATTSEEPTAQPSQEATSDEPTEESSEAQREAASEEPTTEPTDGSSETTAADGA